MVQLLKPHVHEDHKLSHSSATLVIVPIGLCALAMVIHWAMTFGA